MDSSDLSTLVVSGVLLAVLLTMIFLPLEAPDGTASRLGAGPVRR